MATQTVKRVKTSVQPSQVPVVIPVEQSVPVESSASLQVSMAPSVIAPVQSVRKGPRIAPKAPPQ
jgi:hypothetical protein